MKPEVSKSIVRPPKIVLSIRPGPVTPHMKRCFKLFWNRLISECKREVASER